MSSSKLYLQKTYTQIKHLKHLLFSETIMHHFKSLKINLNFENFEVITSKVVYNKNCLILKLWSLDNFH